VKRFLELLKEASPETLNMSIDQCHADGLFSLVFAGTEHGRLTRAFIAKKEIKPFDIQLHSHRYGLTVTVVKGVFRHHIANNTKVTIKLPTYTYKSPLNGGSGLEPDPFFPFFGCIEDYLVPPTGEIHMSHDEVHTVSCEAGTIWIVEEKGFMSDSSRVYGKEFVVDNLYQRPSQYQVNDAVCVLTRALQ
jgi:hypothetical protein